MGKAVVFLDFDGVVQYLASSRESNAVQLNETECEILKSQLVVLNPHFAKIWSRTIVRFKYAVIPNAVRNLKSLLEETGADLVISSTRRIQRSVPELQALLGFYDLGKYVIGKIIAPTGLSDRNRHDAILHYIVTHEIENFVILAGEEDTNEMAEYKQYFPNNIVACNEQTGLSFADCKLAQTILQNPAVIRNIPAQTKKYAATLIEYEQDSELSSEQLPTSEVTISSEIHLASTTKFISELTVSTVHEAIDALQNMHDLQKLALKPRKHHLPLWESEVKKLAAALKTNTSVKSLDFSECGIDDSSGKYLAEALKINNTLQELNLFYNALETWSLYHLGEALKVNRSLQHLNLSSNSIGHSGAEYLIEALESNSTLTSLILSGNRLGWSCRDIFSKLMRTNSTLQVLEIKFNLNNIIIPSADAEEELDFNRHLADLSGNVSEATAAINYFLARKDSLYNTSEIKLHLLEKALISIKVAHPDTADLLKCVKENLVLMRSASFAPAAEDDMSGPSESSSNTSSQNQPLPSGIKFVTS